LIVSIHLGECSRRDALGLLRRRLLPGSVSGLSYAEITTLAPLGPQLLPRPHFRRVGLIAAWEDDRAIDGFLASHALARRLQDGWHVRLRPTRISGSWSRLGALLDHEEPMEDSEPAAVLTLGRLRPSQTVRFLRASARAEGHATASPGLLAATGMARLPLVATFSLWRSVAAMGAYAHHSGEQAHQGVIAAHAQRPFHRESAFIRFRPYGAEGHWDGRDPLAATEPESALVKGG
jgi:hypothetical protein